MASKHRGYKAFVAADMTTMRERIEDLLRAPPPPGEAPLDLPDTTVRGVDLWLQPEFSAWYAASEADRWNGAWRAHSTDPAVRDARRSLTGSPLDGGAAPPELTTTTDATDPGRHDTRAADEPTAPVVDPDYPGRVVTWGPTALADAPLPDVDRPAPSSGLPSLATVAALLLGFLLVSRLLK